MDFTRRGRSVVFGLDGLGEFEWILYGDGWHWTILKMDGATLTRLDAPPDEDGDDDDAGQRQRDVTRAPAQSAHDLRLAHPVGVGRPERSREDVGDPEHQDRVLSREAKTPAPAG